MNNIRKYAYAILFVFALFAFFSCKAEPSNSDRPDNSPTDPDFGPGTGESTTEIKDSLPDGLDFGGVAINIIVRGDVDSAFEFYAEETGDIVDDAIFRRNRAVEDRLNVNLNVIQGPGWQSYSQALSLIRNSIKAGDQAYDVIAGWSTSIAPLSAEDLFSNLLELPHLNLSEAWWNKSITEELTIADKLYFAAGDINLSLLSSSLIIFENNQIRQDYGLPNIYEAVFDGKWTLDYMDGLVKNIHQDLNGDGIMDDKDLFGALWTNHNYCDAFLASSNIRFTAKGEGRIPYLDIERERLGNLTDKVYNFLYNNEGVLVTGLIGSVGGELEAIDMFKNGQAYISAGYLLFASLYFRDMQSEYSIVPYPKYDENQEKYMTLVQSGMSLLCLPENCDKKEAVGAFFEAAASESYKNVSPTYFEVAMKVKYARDETSGKMLDIIRDGANFSFAYIYSGSIGNPYMVMRDLMMAKSNNFTSWHEKNEPKIEKALEKLVSQME